MHVQSIQAYSAVRLKSFDIGNDAFLAIAAQGDKRSPAKSPVLKWNAGKRMLELLWSADTHLANAWEHFRIGSRDCIAVVNSYNFTLASSAGATTVYEWNGHVFQQNWQIYSNGASEVFAFPMASTPYLLIASNGSRFIDS